MGNSRSANCEQTQSCEECAGCLNAKWAINEVIKEFNLTQDYSIDNTFDDLREEYKFLPYQIKDIMERIKTIPAE
jgi:uncharacterized protein (UPF0128 family)